MCRSLCRSPRAHVEHGGATQGGAYSSHVSPCRSADAGAGRIGWSNCDGSGRRFRPRITATTSFTMTPSARMRVCAIGSESKSATDGSLPAMAHGLSFLIRPTPEPGRRIITVSSEGRSLFSTLLRHNRQQPRHPAPWQTWLTSSSREADAECRWTSSGFRCLLSEGHGGTALLLSGLKW